jgi:flagellar basal body-associated protein FliL
MKADFNHAANDSPRSGSDKKVLPIVWAAVIVVAAIMVIWFVMR